MQIHMTPSRRFCASVTTPLFDNYVKRIDSYGINSQCLGTVAIIFIMASKGRLRMLKDRKL